MARPSGNGSSRIPPPSSAAGNGAHEAASPRRRRGRGPGPRAPYKFTPERQAAYFQALQDGYGRHAAAHRVGVSHALPAWWMKHSEAFARQVQEAEAVACGKVENALFKAATIDRNPTAIQVWLYNRAPERWHDARQRIEVSTPEDRPFQVEEIRGDLLRTFTERLARLAAGVGAAAGAGQAHHGPAGRA